jgi:uncharacterized membrane protein
MPEPSRNKLKKFLIMKQEQWSKTTSTIFYGVLIFSLAGIVKAILSPIAAIMETASGLSSLSGGDLSGFFGGSGGDTLSVIVDWIAPIAVILGYILYLSGLGGFKKLLGGADGPAVGKVRTGAILVIIGIVVKWIPFIGWIFGGILSVIGFILGVVGFSKLKNSSSFPESARKGASKLFTALILLIIGWVIGLIPIVGDWIESIFEFIALILTLVGWAKIKNTQVQTA